MTYKTFRLDDIFDKIKTKKLPYKTQQLPKSPDNTYNLPALTAGIENQGLNCFVPRNNATILKHCISVSANGENSGAMFYQPNDFTVLQDSYAIKYKRAEIISDKAYLYLVAAMQKVIRGNYNWSTKAGWERIRSINIELPVTETDEIDLQYMEVIIQGLENAKKQKLEESIYDMDLQDTQLTDEELHVLNSSPSLKMFKVSDLFEVVGTKSLDAGKLMFQQNGINFIGRVGYNNGIQGKIERQKFPPNEPNTFTATVIGNYKYVHYQEEEYYCSQNINKLTPKFKVNRDIALYFVTILHKFVSTYNGQQGGYKLTDLQDFEFSLPITDNGDIDFQYITAYIKALQKLTVQQLYDKGICVNKINAKADASIVNTTNEDIVNHYALMSSNLPSALQNLTPEQMTNALIYAGEQACGEKLDDKYHTMTYNWMNALHQAVMVSTIGIGAIIAADPELQARINTNQNWMRSIQVIKAKITDKRNKRVEVETTITTIIEDDLAALIARGYDKYSVKNTYQEAQSNA